MKNQLRKISLEKRKNFPVEMCSEKIIKNLFSLDEYKDAKNILCYYPLKYEIQTQNCFIDTTKTWFLPRVNGQNLEICKFEKDKLVCGSFNIQEPCTESIDNLNILDSIIIPAVAADKNGYRIGYGKGYYDRFLPKLSTKCVKIILVYSDCLFDNVYPNEYDVKTDIIITDKEILRF